MISTQFLNRVSLLREKVPSFSEYPFNLPVIKELESVDFPGPVSFFVGENGSGKSTLLEAIAVALGFNPEGGSRNFNFATVSSHSQLHEYLRTAKGLRRPRTNFFLRAESFFNVCSEIDRLDLQPYYSPAIGAAYGAKSLHEQSHGEAFLSLLNNRFSAEGLYLLDEPEAALSPQRQLAALARINDLVNQGSQFIIATHAPILLAYPGATIYECTSSGICQASYDSLEHVQTLKAFLNNPGRMLDILLAP